jgi:DNA polymerase-4
MDEAYVDLSASRVPHARAREIKARIKEETRLVCSIGLAPNKLMAKIASDLDKPDGFCALDHDRWLDRVGRMPAKILPGVGPKTDKRLRAIGIETVSQLASADEGRLASTFGANHGAGLRARANGHGSSDLTTDRVRKSESRETTFGADVTDRGELRATMDRLADSVCESLASHASAGRTVTMKIRLRPFRTFTRSRTLSSATRDPEVVKAVARELLERFDPQDPVRLIGVGVAGLVADAAGDAKGASRAAPADGEGDPAAPLTLI